MTRVNICIPTYQRNDGLRALLSSLMSIRLVASVEIEIHVIDNNPDGCAKSVVDSFITEYPSIAVFYHRENRPGVSYVRNTALELSEGASFIVFVDDDETVTEGWFEALWQTQQETGASVVYGSCLAAYSESIPGWIKSGSYHSRILKGDGLTDVIRGAGNSLTDLAVVREHGLTFDTSISEIGGEDTLWFTQLRELGATLANAIDAIVYEHVPASRVTLSWFLRRWRRTGWTDAMVKYRKRSGMAAKVPAFLDGVIRMGTGMMLASFWFLVGGLRLTPKVANQLYTLQRGRGMIDFASGTLIREYGRPDKG